MITLKRTTSEDADFRTLVVALDKTLLCAMAMTTPFMHSSTKLT